MRVLVACEYSGTVRDAFTRQGHYAVSNDILPTESPGEHIQGDALEAIKSFKPDLLIGHPPCTYLSRVGAKWIYTEQCRWANIIKAHKFFLTLLRSPVKMIAIENPRPYSKIGLPQSQQVIQPYMFGDPYEKATHLWLKNLPALLSTVIEAKYVSYVSTCRSSKDRAKFFPGIADAMATQWGNL